MRARLTFLKEVKWNFKDKIISNANCQGCPERAMWSLVFQPDIALNDTCFEGRVGWLSEPTNHGLASGTKFSYINPLTKEVIAVGQVL